MIVYLTALATTYGLALLYCVYTKLEEKRTQKYRAYLQEWLFSVKKEILATLLNDGPQTGMSIQAHLESTKLEDGTGTLPEILNIFTTQGLISASIETFEEPRLEFKVGYWEALPALAALGAAKDIAKLESRAFTRSAEGAKKMLGEIDNRLAELHSRKTTHIRIFSITDAGRTWLAQAA